MKAGVPRLAPLTPVTAPVAANANDVYVPPVSVTVTEAAAALIVKVAPALVTV